MRKTLGLAALLAGVMAATAAQADITIGFVTSLSGNGSSIGIPYGRGIAAAVEYKNEVNGEKIRLIQLDDGSDPSAATRNARKLIEEEKVDLLIGTATAPSRTPTSTWCCARIASRPSSLRAWPPTCAARRPRDRRS